MLCASKMSFDEYLAKGDFCVRYPIYTGLDSEAFLVDNIIKYESLDQELGEVFSRLIMHFSGHLEPRAKSLYRSNKVFYRQLITPSQSKIIELAFEKEILMHGYFY